jgi:hypothetical protein
MQSGPEKQSAPQPRAPTELDNRSFEPFIVRAHDKFSRCILHYGVKAVAHAALADRTLESVENSREIPAGVFETFKVRSSPLTFSLSGLQKTGVILPIPAITASNVFWPNFFPTPDRLGFAHPDFINPLMLHPGSPGKLVVPSSFFQLDWSKDDLADRAKMGATLIVAERIWESCVNSFRQSFPRGELIVGSVEQLVNYYSGFIASLKLGDNRNESLAAGERFLGSLVRRDEEIAAKVLYQARLAASETETNALEGNLPPSPETPRRMRAKAARDESRSTADLSERKDLENLQRIEALTQIITSSDPEVRSEGIACLKAWQGEFSNPVRSALNKALRLGARVESGLTQLDAGREVFERGETAEGIRLVREIAAKTEIPLIRSEARQLLKTFGRVLTALAREEEPTEEWPKEGRQRRLTDVVLAAYNHGSDAEVICHDGLKRSGRLCFGGLSPRSLKLLDFSHEVTWSIELTSIQSIKFFYDKDPIPPRSQGDTRPPSQEETA